MKRLALIIIFAGLIGGCVYLVIAGRTTTWPTAPCAVVASRVIRADGPYGPDGAVMVLYKGEYEVRYRVNAQAYFTWVNAGWLDKDKGFVESKVSDLPDACPVVIRYNPKDPSHSVTD